MENLLPIETVFFVDNNAVLCRVRIIAYR